MEQIVSKNQLKSVSNSSEILMTESIIVKSYITYVNNSIIHCRLTISWAAQVLLELRDNATCPSSANTTEVESCLEKIFDEVDERKKETNPFESLLDYEGRVNRFCKADCFSK